MGFLDKVQAAAKAFVGDAPGTAPAVKPAVASVSVPAAAPVAPAAAPGVAPAAPVSEAKPAVAPTVAHDTQEALAKAASGQQLGVLRQLIEGGVNTFINPLKLNGKTFSGDVPNDLNFATDANKAALRLEISGYLKDLSLEQFKVAFPTLGELPSLDQAKDLFAEMCAVHFLKKAEAEFKKNYGEHFAAFIGKNPDYKLRYKIDVGEFGQTVSFKSSPEDFDAKYKKFAEENGADKKAEQPKASEQDPDRAARIAALEKSWLGGLLKTLGIVELDEAGKAKFGDVVDGNNWFGGIVVGLFGGSHLLSDSKAYADMVAGLDPKYKGLLEGIEKKARTSPFALTNKKVAEASADGAAQGTDVVYDEVDDNKFKLFVSGSETFPEKGVKLNKNYTVERGKVLRTDLNLAEIIVPKGGTLNLDNEPDQTATTADISLKGRILGIKNAIPKGTIFKGKPTFELV